MAGAVPASKVNAQWVQFLSEALLELRCYTAGNALARVQRVHAPADLWDITFCTR